MRWRTWPELAALFMLLVPLASAGERLAVMVEDEDDPWSKGDGTGLANDIVKEAFAAVNVSVDLQVVPYARCKLGVMRGEVAACFNMSWIPEFKDHVRFADVPLYNCRTDYFQSRKEPLAVHRERDIPAGTVVGIVTGYEYPPSLERLRDKGVVFKEAVSEEILVKMLSLGRLQLAVINQNGFKTAKDLLARTATAGHVEYAFESGLLGSFIGFSTANPKGEWARSKFNEGYGLLKKSGRLAAIERRWHK